jgi:alpha-galactosidase
MSLLAAKPVASCSQTVQGRYDPGRQRMRPLLGNPEPAVAWPGMAFAFAASFALALNYNVGAMNYQPEVVDRNLPTATALQLREKLDARGFPLESSWAMASPIRFDHDWRGQNADAGRATEVRLLWTPETLFFRFKANYRDLNLYRDAREDGWRDKLWDRDVAETFLQADSSDPFKYKEFEVAPNGFWIDLDVSHGSIRELHSKLRRIVIQNNSEKTWTAELAIPIESLTPVFDPNHAWRVNFYRIEGQTEPRFYSAWSPTYSPQPNFHVPAAFGKLVFEEAK